MSKTQTSSPNDAPHVLLTPGLSGSTLFHRALLDAVARFPALAKAEVPVDKKVFKERFAEVLVRFEAHRADSPERTAIAAALAESLESALHFGTEAHSVPLLEHLKTAGGEAPKLSRHPGGAKAGWLPEMTFRGVSYRGRELLAVVEIMRRERLATEAALSGIRWTIERMVEGRVDLSGHRFAILGAGAELAPTAALVAAGAEVLWVDKRAPDELLRVMHERKGTLVTMDDGDILAAPEKIKAAIESFAGGERVHVGLFAYAPGRGRELRLAHAMQAMVDAMGARVVKSVAMFVSPTTPGEVPAEEREYAAKRRADAALWKKALEKARVLKAPGHFTVGSATISHSLVGLQGTTYQAAQYLAKMMAAEALCSRGIVGSGERVTVSANVAGITATRSLEHPLFTAGFIGAPRFGIEIFDPQVTRTLSTLLMIHDLLNPDAPGSETRSGNCAAVASQSIHGGVRALPWEIEELIQVAAVMGLGKRPKLLLGLLPKKKKKKA